MRTLLQSWDWSRINDTLTLNKLAKLGDAIAISNLKLCNMYDSLTDCTIEAENFPKVKVLFIKVLLRCRLTRCTCNEYFQLLINFTFESFPHRLKQVFVSFLNLPEKTIIRKNISYILQHTVKSPGKRVLWNNFFVKENPLISQ